MTEVKTNFEFPSNTYAYTTTTEQIYVFQKTVSIESFWLRLHQAPQAFKEDEFGTRYVKVYNDEKLVSSQIFNLWSDEWYLITTAIVGTNVFGNKLVIEAGTDLDSLVL